MIENHGDSFFMTDAEEVIFIRVASFAVLRLFNLSKKG